MKWHHTQLRRQGRRHVRNELRDSRGKLGGKSFSIEPLERRDLLAVVISEFMAANNSTIADEDGAFSDWLELRNTGGQTVNLDGWYLTDDATDLDQWRIPNVDLVPGEHLLIFASNNDRQVAGSELHTNFRLGAGGEYLGLIESDGVTVAYEYAPEYPNQEDDVSYGLSANQSTIGYFPSPTPGAPNAGEPIPDPSRAIVISEIMYHPSSENILEEYIELHNHGTQSVNLDGWQLTAGANFVFPNVTLNAGQYLAVAADVATFAAKYPGVNNVVGGWTGRLSNRSETIRLVDATGSEVDEVTYADQGDWAVRREVEDGLGGEGWIWEALHDGGDEEGNNGKSLELINPAVSNEFGQNWTSSLPDNGTPGAANSQDANNIAPLVLDVIHGPIIPSSSDPVTVTAEIRDELGTGVTATLFFRVDGTQIFQSMAMQDDGVSGDGALGDGTYAATIPARDDGTIVEFYVRAEDAGNNTRTWPAADAIGRQEANALYQVDDSYDPDATRDAGSLMQFYQIMTEQERIEFENLREIGSDTNPSSNAQKNGTWVIVDGTGVDVRYSTGLRVRGSASRGGSPWSNRINVPSDRPWRGLDQLNLNASQPGGPNSADAWQNYIAGSALWRLGGLPAADGFGVWMYRNGEMVGDLPFAYLEATNSDMAANQFEGDSGGNLYRGRRGANRDYKSPPGSENAGLQFRGNDADFSDDDPTPYGSYIKLTNAGESDWTDVMELTYHLNNCDPSGGFQQCGLDEYPEDYLENIETVVNVDQWLRTLAMTALIDYNEFALITGDASGDDYMMYRGIEDPRFQLVPHDMDASFRSVTRSIWRFEGVPTLNRLVHHPEIEPRYYGHLLDLIDNVMLTDLAATTLDEALRGASSQPQIDALKTFVQQRAEYVRGLIPQELTINTALPVVGEFFQTTSAALVLDGSTPAAETRSVLINGYPATSLPGDGTWSFISTQSGGGGGNITLVATGSDWRYLDDGSDQGTTWREAGFDDSTWAEGPAQLGYGDGDEATAVGFIDLDPGPGEEKNATTYFRKDFNVADPSQVASLTLRLLYDDAAAVYLNGTEIVRTGNLPEGATFDEYASVDTPDENAFFQFVLPGSAVEALVSGTNTLAVEIHQGDAFSSDISFDLELSAGIETGGDGGITLMSSGSVWNYLDDGSDQGTAWRGVGFDDTAWSAGPAQLGYGEGDEATETGFIDVDPIEDGDQKNATTYFRSSFQVAAPEELIGLSLQLLYDDAAVVYINGVEAARTDGLPADPAFDTYSEVVIGGAEENIFTDFVVPPSVLSALVAGENTIAVDVHQANPGSSDISFDLELIGQTGGGTSGDGTGLALHPGVNRIFVEAFDGPHGNGNRIASQFIDVWYDGAAVTDRVDYQPAEVQAVDLRVRDTYLPGVPFLVRVDALDENGNVERELWDAVATLTVDNPDIRLSTREVQLVNGMGSALVTATGTGPFAITAWVGTSSDSRSLANLEGAEIAEATGILSGGTTTWSGVVHVTGDVTVPAGATLNVAPGTLVLLDGDPVGATDSTVITVNGTLNSLGTKAQPVTFTSFGAGDTWGQIDFNGGDGDFDHTVLHRAGNAVRLGHTNSGAAIRMRGGANVTFDEGTISDLRGKTLHSTSGNLSINNSLLTRSAMGPEIDDTALEFHGNWIVDMAGIYHHSGVVDDNDGIYLHTQAGGQEINLSGGVLAGTEDDGIDTLGSTITVGDYIVRDVFDKAISANEGAVDVGHTLIADSDIGVSTKANNNQTANTSLDHLTIVNVNTGVQAENDNGDDPLAIISYVVNNSIIRVNEGGDAVFTDYDPADVVVTYSNVEEAWPGAGNIDVDPAFANPTAHNFRPLPGSPSIDAGDPASPVDPDGTVTDQGYIVNGLTGVPANTTFAGGTISEDTILTPSGGPYRFAATTTVAAGAKLIILPGTSIYFDEDVELNIEGELIAEGSQYQRIRFTSDPAAPPVPDIPGLPDGPPRWDGIHLRGTRSDANLISHADVEYAQNTDGAIGIIESDAVLDSITVRGTHRRMVYGDDASFVLRNSMFPDMFGPGEMPAALGLDNVSEHVKLIGAAPVGGQQVIQNNVFGTNKGHNDVIDADSGRVPDPILQILDNVFMGAGDEQLDLGGDVYVAGNLFQNIFKDDETSDRGYANAISTGDAGAGTTIVAARNFFIDVDHAINLKRDTATIFENNTVYKIHPDFLDRFGNPNVGAAITLFVDEPGGTAGDGAYVEGNIFWDLPRIFGDPDQDDTVSDLELNYNLIDPAVADNAVGDRPGTVLDLGIGNIVGEPRFVDIATGNFSLDFGSLAEGAGPLGQDLGADIRTGIWITGEPPRMTDSTSAALTVGGPGIFGYRYRVDGGAWSADLPIGNGFDPENGTVRTAQIDLTGLSAGPHTVEVLGQDYAAVWQDEPTVSRTWIVESVVSSVRINEVLASNQTALDHEGTTPDVIELYNDGTVVFDLSGMSISDDAANPTKYVFPASTALDPGDFLVLFANDQDGTSGIHLGFRLDGKGEGVHLYDTPNGGGLVDSVEFGIQVTDLSIGRVGPDGHWTLNQPTPGEDNVEQSTGNPNKLFINEWVTSSDVRVTNDFVELHNSDDLPAPLGGLHLTDHPNTVPDKFQIAPLSFIAGSGYTTFIADGDPQDGADHLNFRLSVNHEQIGLFDQQLGQIDRVMYFAQQTDVSQGRFPDGGPEYAFSVLPTPNVSNGQTGNTGTVVEVGWNDEWLYNDSGDNLGTACGEPGFNDSAWDSGPGTFGVDNDPVVIPIMTPIPVGPTTFYFRTHFTLDVDPADVDASLVTLLDDGAVVYVNGNEVARLRVDPGAPFDEPANDWIAQAFVEGPFAVPSNFLVQGENVIAVEVHQGTVGVGDMVFGLNMEISQSLPNPSSVPLDLMEGLRITEINYHPDDSGSEFIELTNISNDTLNLSGVRIDDGVQFTFPDIMIEPGEHVVVAGNLEEFIAKYGSGPRVVGQYSGNLGDGGENLVLQLADPYEAAILRFDYEDDWYPTTDGGGASLEIVDPLARFDLWGKKESWQASTVNGGTPGTDSAIIPPPIGIVINEVLTHTDPPQVDAIELHNTTNQSIDVGGWFLSDSNDNYLKFQIDDGITIPGGGYMVFDESHFNPSMGLDPENNPNDFALDSAHGDQVWLWSSTATNGLDQVVDYVDFGAGANGESFGRVPNGTGTLAPNTRLTLGCGNSHARIGPVLVTEVNYNPGTPSAAALAADPNVTDKDLEFVEILNSGGVAEDLTNWRLRGGADFDFVGGTMLGAGEVMLLVSFDPNDAANASRLAAFRAHYGIGAAVRLVGGFSGDLSNGGETVALQRPDEPPVGEPSFIPHLTEDEFRYDEAAPWATSANGTGDSLQRVGPSTLGSFSTAWSGSTPTPGTVSFTGGVPGDITGDGAVDVTDIDALLAAIHDGATHSFFDLDTSGTVDLGDVQFLVENIIGTFMGDTNLNGSVDAVDFNVWNDNKFQSFCPSWATADFNGDGTVDGSDFNIWNDNKFSAAAASADGGPVGVPRAPLGAGRGIVFPLVNESIVTNEMVIPVGNHIVTKARQRFVGSEELRAARWDTVLERPITIPMRDGQFAASRVRWAGAKNPFGSIDDVAESVTGEGRGVTGSAIADDVFADDRFDWNGLRLA